MSTDRILLPREEVALLVIDMQNGFVHPDSAMGKSVAGTATQRAIVPPILALAGFCRQRSIPVLWSRQEHFPQDQARARRRIQSHAARQGFLPCLRGTWETEFYPEIQCALGAEDHVVVKHRASAFYNTNLETKLRMLGTRVLLIAGCNTEFCVESTVRDAYARDFELLMVRDCVAGIQEQFHRRSLELFQAYFGEVVNSAELDRWIR
jgi:ureidoacrylate peracid hydrolase